MCTIAIQAERNGAREIVLGGRWEVPRLSSFVCHCVVLIYILPFLHLLVCCCYLSWDMATKAAVAEGARVDSPLFQDHSPAAG